jgi:hypothetical protein
MTSFKNKVIQCWNDIDLKEGREIIEKRNYNEELIRIIKSDGMWTGFIWLGIGNSGVMLRTY